MGMNILTTIKVLRSLPTQQSVLLRGDHGIGKSAIVRQVAEARGVAFIDFRGSQNDIGDIKGLPFRDGDHTRFLSPDWFPEVGVGPQEGILFLDEINRASRDVQQAIFELVLDRRLNMKPLPVGWQVIAAINHREDLYQVEPMDPALLSRFMVIDLEPSVEEWLTHARFKKIHSGIIGFISSNRLALDPPAEIREHPEKVFPTRRSWIMLSETLSTLGVNMDAAELDTDTLFKVCSGFVGESVAGQLLDWLDPSSLSLTPEQIIENMDAQIQETVRMGWSKHFKSWNNGVCRKLESLRDHRQLEEKHFNNVVGYMKAIPGEVLVQLWYDLQDSSCREDFHRFYRGCGELKQIMLSVFGAPEASNAGP
jgi:hypothetical protein